MSHPQFDDFYRSIKLDDHYISRSSNEYVTENIYKRSDTILSKLVKQEAPRRSQFMVITTGSTSPPITRYENRSWAIFIENSSCGKEINIMIPVTEPLTDADDLWYPILLKGKRKGHYMLLIETVDRFILFDPNFDLVFFSGFPGDELLTAIKNAVALKDPSKTFVRLMHNSFNDTCKFMYDRGQCGPWSILIAHMGYCMDIDYQSIIDTLNKLDLHDRTELIYKYSGFIYCHLV